MMVIERGAEGFVEQALFNRKRPTAIVGIEERWNPQEGDFNPTSDGKGNGGIGGNGGNGNLGNVGAKALDAIGMGPDTAFGKYFTDRNPDGSRKWAGGENSVLNQAWDLVTQQHKDEGGANPTTSSPTQADAAQAAIAQQLSAERRAYSASSILTGGQGLLDQPTTSSRVLLGS